MVVGYEDGLDRDRIMVAHDGIAVVAGTIVVVHDGAMVTHDEVWVADGGFVVVEGGATSKMSVAWVADERFLVAEAHFTCSRNGSATADAHGRVALVSYSLAALSKRTGASGYRIRHYVQAGIVPPARRAGSASVYDEGHVERLAVIEQLRARKMSVSAIRQHVRTLNAQQLRVLAGLEAESPSPPVVTKPARGAREMRDAVDALLCVGAEALDISPKALRPAFAAVFARMIESELTPADVVAVLVGGGEGA